MAREYSEKGFILEIDDYSLLEQYFKNRNIDGFSYVKNRGKKRELDIDQIITTIETVIRDQSEVTQQEIEADFAHINELANEKGSQNLIAEANDQKLQIPLETVANFNNYDRSLWFFNNYPGIFEKANAIQQFYDLSGWKRVPVPSKDIDFIVNKKEDIEESLKKYYEQEARGRHCLIECYPKNNRVYIVASISDYATSDLKIDEKTGKVSKKGTRRPFFEIYYLYHSDNEESGELEIKAKGGKQKQGELLKVFAKSVFGIELDDSKRTFDLDLLKNKNFSIASDAEDQMEWWSLKSLELLTPDGQQRIKLTVNDKNHAGTEEMWKLLKRMNLDDQMQNLKINNADLQIKFTPSRKHQRGSVSFNINWKDQCSLNNIDDMHQKARALLIKSKIDCGFTQKNSK